MPEIFFDDRYFHGGFDLRDEELTRPLPAGAAFALSEGSRQVAVIRARSGDRAVAQPAAALEAVGYAARLWYETQRLAVVTIRTPRPHPSRDLIVFACGTAAEIAAAVERQEGAGPWRTLMRGDLQPGQETLLTGRDLDPRRPAPELYFDPRFFAGSVAQGTLRWPTIGTFAASGWGDGIDGLVDPLEAVGTTIRLWHEQERRLAQTLVFVDADVEEEWNAVFAIGSARELARLTSAADRLEVNPQP